MNISIPKLSLVVLVGPSGSGKSTFACKHFLPSGILSSDDCRGLVSDDENDQSATLDAFEVLHFVAAKRMARGRLVVVDATNVQQEARAPLVALARKFHVLPVAIVLDLSEALCQERNLGRADRSFGPHVIRQQSSQLRRSLRGLRKEGFRHIFVMKDVAEVDAAVIERVPLWNDRTSEHGSFDIIGDVHGCADELEELLGKLGYSPISIDGTEPGYTADENLVRLRSRGLAGKRSLALREFALGIEALERFVRHEPLRRVHECVFGVLALESEPVDPRL